MRRDVLLRTATPLLVCALLNAGAYLQARGIDALAGGWFSRQVTRDVPAAAFDLRQVIDAAGGPRVAFRHKKGARPARIDRLEHYEAARVRRVVAN